MFNKCKRKESFPKERDMKFLECDISNTKRETDTSFTDTRSCILGAASCARMGNASESREKPFSPGTCRFYRKGNPFASLSFVGRDSTHVLLLFASVSQQSPPFSSERSCCLSVWSKVARIVYDYISGRTGEASPIEELYFMPIASSRYIFQMQIILEMINYFKHFSHRIIWTSLIFS